MTPEETPGGAEIDPGPPLQEVAELREEPGPQFLHRIRDGIQRRLSAAQILDFSINAFLDFLKEMLSLAFGFLGRAPRNEGGRRHE